MLEDQKTETFKWLLSTFFEFMVGKEPDVIMIDQDTTMRKTIQEFILGTVHRNPFWHIMRNAREHLGTLIMTREGLSHQVDFVAVAQGIG